MVLTERFKTRDGYLYDIEFSEDGLEAHPSNGVLQHPAGYSINRADALDEWIKACAMLGVPV